MKPNKHHKDTVFSRYFSEEPSRLVSLYNALEGTNYPEDTPVEINTLDDALYKDRINDLSFILDGQLVVLVEHQSTINQNMALRMLMYMGRLYEKIIPSDVEYKSTLHQIPTPKFIVLYNGEKSQPFYSQQKLSNAFLEAEEQPMLELLVDVWNINYDDTKDIMCKCPSLSEYSQFIACIRQYQSEGFELAEAIQEAIRYCSAHNIMPKFLQQNGSEVQNMLFAEWKWEDALRVREKEGEQRGEKRGERRGTLNTLFDLVVRGKLDIDEAASTAKVSQNDFLTELQIQYPNFIPN